MSKGFLLDTNVPSELTKPNPDSQVRAWIASHGRLHLSVVTIGEMRKGFQLLARGKRRTDLEEWFQTFLLPLVASRILPVTEAVAERWGIVSAERQSRGAPLSTADGLIAATALELDLVLVTRNVRDFADVGLTILNPWQ